MSRRYAIVGTGALGGYYGGLLAKAGFEVNFLARSDFAAIKAKGLEVRSKDGDFRIAEVRVFDSAAKMPKCDVVVVALKTTANDHLREILPHLLSDHGVALVLQNGLCPEADTAQVVGADRVLGGCCFLCSTKIDPGCVEHLDYGPITLGEYATPDAPAAGITERLQAVTSELRSAGVSATAVPDLWAARFAKLVWNVPFNGLSVVNSASTDQLVNLAEPLVRMLMAEVVAIAKAWGRDLGSAVIDKMIDNTRKMKPYDSSMRMDWKRGQPMELDAIYGALLRAAAQQDCQAPCITMLYHQLRFMEAQQGIANKPSRGQ